MKRLPSLRSHFQIKTSGRVGLEKSGPSTSYQYLTDRPTRSLMSCSRNAKRERQTRTWRLLSRGIREA